MGFQDNVNVDVRGAAHIAPCTYKTVVLKQNITKQNLNVLTQAMLDEWGRNTKFVIRWDYDLTSNITVPKNCLIEFDGGSIDGDGHTLTGDDTILIYDIDEDAVMKDVVLAGTFIRKTGGETDKKDNTDGMGKIYLKKDKPFGEQLTQENTIYVIKYDFTLGGNITIPANCVLEFDGGSISGNGTGKDTITGTNTQIIANKVAIFTGIIIAGTWNVPNIYSSWFSDITSTNKIKQLVNLSSDSIFNTIIIEEGNYPVVFSSNNEAALLLKSHTKLIINGDIMVAPNAFEQYYVIRAKEVKDIEICGSGSIIGDVSEHTGDSGDSGMGIDFRQVKFGKISDLTIKDCWGDGIYIGGMAGNQNDPYDFTVASENIVISNVVLDNNRRNNISVTHGNFVNIEKCSISNAGKTNGINPKAGIDIESNWESPWWSNNANIFIEGCVFEGNSSSAIKSQGKGGIYYKNINIINCKADTGFTLHSSNILVNKCTFNGIGIGSNNSENIENISITNSKITDYIVTDNYLFSNAQINNCEFIVSSEYFVRTSGANTSKGTIMQISNSIIKYSGDTFTRNPFHCLSIRNSKIYYTGANGFDSKGAYLENNDIYCEYIRIYVKTALGYYRYYYNRLHTTSNNCVFCFQTYNEITSFEGTIFEIVDNVLYSKTVPFMIRDGSNSGELKGTSILVQSGYPNIFEFTGLEFLNFVQRHILFLVDDTELSGSSYPKLTYNGQNFVDNNTNRSLHFIKGVGWSEAEGTRPVIKYGTTEQRPKCFLSKRYGSNQNNVSITAAYIGMNYFNTTNNIFYIVQSINGDTVTWVEESTIKADIPSDAPRDGTTEQIPIDDYVRQYLYVGFEYYNSDINRFIYVSQITAESVTWEERLPYKFIDPTDIGFRYFDTTLGKNIYVRSTNPNTGNMVLVEEDGALAGVLRSGSTANRPAASSIYVGFKYYDTTLNKPIYWNGNEWVDATGATV